MVEIRCKFFICPVLIDNASCESQGEKNIYACEI
jgi:hypothetical protein